MAFELLSKPIRKYIRDMGWQQLRPIQSAAISKIINSEDNYILSSRTASGKTEAAFLPILSKVDFSNLGVQVLYISPLIALINDQFYRIEELCKYLDVSVTKWHGEANKSLKEKLVKEPNGIVLITPESLEAMFVNKPFYIKQLFSNLNYVVIDEIHSFIGTDRGTQLKSILYRLQRINSKSIHIIGLSATIGDYSEAKKFIGTETNTKVLVDRTSKEINAIFKFFRNENEGLPVDLLKDLYTQTKENKVLIFPNSRGKAEEVAVNLKRISERENGHSFYFSHHSSVDRELREHIETFAKNNKRYNFCIACTSTLELGIDIGTVDEVVQIDSTHSISSLIQRVGRSGRKDGEISNLFLYATNSWSLLQSIACWLLYQESYIEPSEKNDSPYDILVHQILSITKEHSGILLKDLLNHIKENNAFLLIEESEVHDIIQHLISIDFLEKINNELIIGVEGEKIVNSRGFYSVFKTEENYKVISGGNSIGEIPYSPQIIEEQNILLSAKIWKIKLIDHKSKKINVVPTNDGKPPIFTGTMPAVHKKIREKMLQILYSKNQYDFLDESSANEIEKLRNEFLIFKIHDLQNERPLMHKENELILYTFTGTRINRTIQLLLNICGIKNIVDEKNSSIRIEASKQDFILKWENINQAFIDIDSYISNLLETNLNLLEFSKWGAFLPRKYQIQLIKNKYFDLIDTKELLSNLKFITNQ